MMANKARQAANVTRRQWYSPGILDQGPTPQCVEFSWHKWLTSGPVTNVFPYKRGQLYKECQRVDEWPGEDYDGTSVRAGARVLKDRGLISEYRWGFDAETIINHILTSGPVVVGTEWLDGMFEVDKYGYLNCSGPPQPDQGHAYLLIGADREKVHPKLKKTGAVRKVGSWGEEALDHGRAWMFFDDLDMLIKRDGEACIGMEVKG
jgi:hypothetical protein